MPQSVLDIIQELKSIKVEYKYQIEKKVLAELPYKYNCIQTNPMEAVMNLNSSRSIHNLVKKYLLAKKQEKARITKIEHFEKSGDIVINTTRGTWKVLYI